MGDKIVYCKCGCGKILSNKKLKQGGIFYNHTCANRFNSRKRCENNHKKEHQKALRMDINDRFFYNGKSKCANYDDNNIKCVMCFEKEEYLKKDCRVKPRSINV